MADILSDPIWWVGIFAGSIFGLIIAAFIRGLYFFIRDFKKIKKIKIRGTWYTYNMTNKDETITLAKYKWKFRRSFLTGKNIASVTSELDDTINYEAELEIKEKHLFIYGRGKGHKENVTWVFRRKYPHTRQTSYSGACIGLDYDEKLFCGITLLSKDKLPSEYVQNVLEERYINCKSNSSSKINLLEGAGDYPPIHS